MLCSTSASVGHLSQASLDTIFSLILVRLSVATVSKPEHGRHLGTKAGQFTCPVHHTAANSFVGARVGRGSKTSDLR